MANITLYRKSDETITFQYYESDGTTARSLSSATVMFTVKKNNYDTDADDSEALITKDISSHTDAAAGQSSITLTDTDLDIEPGNYFYDIRVQESDGNVYVAQSGRCLVSSTPTNRTV